MPEQGGHPRPGDFPDQDEKQTGKGSRRAQQEKMMQKLDHDCLPERNMSLSSSISSGESDSAEISAATRFLALPL